MAPAFGGDLRRKLRFIRFVTATDRHTSADAAIVPAPALSGAVPPEPAPGAPRCRSALRQPAQLLAQTLHLPAKARDALAQRRVLPLHKTRHRPPFREGALPLVQPFRVVLL